MTFFFCAWLVFLIKLSRSKQTVPPVTRRDGVRCWLVDPLRQSWIFALKLPTPSNLIATATLAAAAELFLDAQMRLDIGRALESARLSFDRCAAQQLKKDCWWGNRRKQVNVAPDADVHRPRMEKSHRTEEKERQGSAENRGKLGRSVEIWKGLATGFLSNRVSKEKNRYQLRAPTTASHKEEPI